MMTARTVEQLVSAMTWREKLEQLQIQFRVQFDDAAALARGGTGALFWPGSAAKANELQRVAIEESRHGIPLLIGLDVVHGQFTIFPTPLAQAASFDPEVAGSDARISAAEARSNGVNWTFSPMVDTSRDPRWGRVVEGFGEDSFLTSVFGAEKVRGYQGEDLSQPDSIAACLKHFVAYGAAEAGRDYNTTDVSRRRLRETYLPPFRAGVQAGAAAVMASFNSLNGTPMHAHRGLLTDLLKQEWGFEGVVVGDAEGVSQLIQHGFAADERAAAAAALQAGLDVVMGDTLFTPEGQPRLEIEDVDVDRLDEAVLCVLRLKERLGLFENPFVDESVALTTPAESSLHTAQEAAERCIVLLKNDTGTLPLSKAPRKVLLTGPYATSTDHLGAWVQHFAHPSTSLADAFAKKFHAIEWTVAPGADFLDSSDESVTDAARLARQHDLIVLAVGEPSALSGEASSRSDLRLPGDQEKLIHAIADTGVPFIVLLCTGRPLVVDDWIDRAPDVLLTWHLGTRGPEAIARVLAGDVDAGGRVPMAFPRAVGQIPIHHDHERTGRPASSGGTLAATALDVGLHGPDNLGDVFTSKYLDLPLGPRFAFGHGLSYTAFTLGEPTVSRHMISRADLSQGATIEVSVDVTNVGKRAGDDVILLLLADPVASVTQPVQRLRGFQRVHLGPGDSRFAHFILEQQDLAFWTDDDELRLEDGELILILTDGTVRHEITLTIG